MRILPKAPNNKARIQTIVDRLIIQRHKTKRTPRRRSGTRKQGRKVKKTPRRRSSKQGRKVKKSPRRRSSTCKRQASKEGRPSPAYAAKDCRGKVKIKHGVRWKSVADKNGRYHWKKLKGGMRRLILDIEQQSGGRRTDLRRVWNRMQQQKMWTH